MSRTKHADHSMRNKRTNVIHSIQGRVVPRLPEIQHIQPVVSFANGALKFMAKPCVRASRFATLSDAGALGSM